MQNLDVQRTANAWSSLSQDVFVPHSQAEYDRIIALLDNLIDEVGEDERHPLASLMGLLDEKMRRARCSCAAAAWRDFCSSLVMSPGKRPGSMRK